MLSRCALSKKSILMVLFSPREYVFQVMITSLNMDTKEIETSTMQTTITEQSMACFKQISFHVRGKGNPVHLKSSS